MASNGQLGPSAPCCCSLDKAKRNYGNPIFLPVEKQRRAISNVSSYRDSNELEMAIFEACQGPALAPVDNIFARIIRKEEPADIVHEDGSVMAFRDANPVAPYHFLIVPMIGAVRNPSHLTVQHIDLLEQMIEVGKKLLKDKAGLTPNQQTAQATLGFHMPPWTMVPHLHMHAIAPLRSLKWWQRLHFLVGSFWYQSAEKILERLKSQQTTQLTL